MNGTGSSLLKLVLDAHGGLDDWRKTTAVDLRLSLRGNTLRIKHHPDGLRGVLVKIDTRAPRTLISPLPHPGRRGLFDHGKAVIQTDEGEADSHLDDPRPTFAGHERHTPWTDLQFVYFFGYAFWNYFTTPFLLASDGVTCEELAPHEEHGETWRVLKAAFERRIDTHCAEQLFYFGEDGLLRRHDYFTDVGRGNVGHYVYDHRVYDGFVFPTHRRVVLRDETGRTELSGPSSFLIDIDAVVVTRAGSADHGR